MMSLQTQAIPAVPEETARVARAAFPKGSPYMAMRDAIGTLYTDADFASLYPTRGQPAAAPWRLALICVMQYAEGLSDRQAAEAVRGRIDWKYALGLELTDAGFDFSVLSEFRDRLIAGGAEQRLLDRLLAQCKERGWLKERGSQRTDSTHVLAAVRTLNRIELVGETLRAALNALAVVAPEWLQEQVNPAWFDRYSLRLEEERLPKGLAARQAYAATIGMDGLHLLSAVYAPAAPVWLRAVPAVAVLRQVWIQQYVVVNAVLRWRSGEELPPVGQRIESPYDPEGRFGNKGHTEWLGYKVHVSETCGAATVHLITEVETTPAHETDASRGEAIHAALAAKGLLPAEHLLDTGYVDAEYVRHSQAAYGIEVVGPMHPDTSWQAQTPGAYDLSCFTVDWATHTVTCPQGKTNATWTLLRDVHGNPGIGVRFKRADCPACPARPLCTRSQTTPRHLTLRPQALHEILQTQRQHQRTATWQQRYHQRAGIEGTLSQGVRAFGVRRTRYWGLAKTRLQHLLTAVAINVVRLVAWLGGVSHAKTRTSRFAALAPHAA